MLLAALAALLMAQSAHAQNATGERSDAGPSAGPPAARSNRGLG
jgi:hypothetical protein